MYTLRAAVRLLLVVTVLLSTLAGLAIGQTLRCDHEDSIHCVWVGSQQGNGRGDIVINW